MILISDLEEHIIGCFSCRKILSLSQICIYGGSDDGDGIPLCPKCNSEYLSHDKRFKEAMKISREETGFDTLNKDSIIDFEQARKQPKRKSR